MSQNQEKLTGVMLNGKNYHVWARQVVFALSGREKSDHIDSENKAPKQSDPPTESEKRALARWKVSDHTVITWLLATMEPQVSDLLSYKDTALEIWQRAEKLYGHKKNYAHIYQIQREMQQAKQQQGQPAMNLFGFLQKKKDEIRVYRPPTTDLAEIKKREEQDDVFQFLSCLDSSYEALRSQILLMAELPSPDEVASMIQGEETRREVMGSQNLENLEAKGFAAMARPNPNFRSEGRGDQGVEKCEHCKREGHRKEACWFLYPHLRPKWHKKGDRRGDHRGGVGTYLQKGNKGVYLTEGREAERNGSEPFGKNHAEANNFARMNPGATGVNYFTGANPTSANLANFIPCIMPSNVSGSHEAINSDSMRQLLQQLSVMLNQKQENAKKTSGSDNQDYDW